MEEGNTYRGYTAEDTDAGIYNAMNYLFSNTRVFDTINLGNSYRVTLNELIDLLYKLMNKSPDIHEMAVQPGDVKITYADISKAKKSFNYQPQKELREGPIDFINWYNEQKK